MSQNSDSLGISGLLPASQDLYDTFKGLMEFVDGNNESFVPSSENENILTDLDGELGSSTQYAMLKQEIEEPQAPIEKPQLQRTAIPLVLSSEEYAGPLNFEVLLDPNGAKQPWVYSSVLRKIFIGMNTTFPVDFKWTPAQERLFLRVTPTFSLPQHNHELVLRCIQHAQGSDASNKEVPTDVWDHIIRCNNMDAVYMGDKRKGLHLNVVVPLSKPQTGTETVREMFRFMCKNSCPSGMNRRPIQILFTIEDENFEILGRRVLQVRICSCPKRDKEKEEKEHLKTDHKEPYLNGKKRKVDSVVDTTEYKVKVVGKQNFVKVAQLAIDVMKSAALDAQGSNAELFKKAAADLKDLLKDHSA